MNQKEWKTLSKLKKENRPKDLFHYRNLAVKLLGWKRGKSLVIHHLRNTEEERNFNDKYYERWGIDFDGKLKYTVLMTTEEHKQLHSTSDETKEKISKSVSIAKTKYTKEEIREHINTCNKAYRETHKEAISQKKKIYYLNNKEEIKAKVKKRRENNPEKHKLANKLWKEKNREYVRQKKREYYARHKKKM